MATDDAFECIRECTHVEEAAELILLIKTVVDSEGAAARTIAPRFTQIVRYIFFRASWNYLLCQTLC